MSHIVFEFKVWHAITLSIVAVFFIAAFLDAADRMRW